MSIIGDGNEELTPERLASLKRHITPYSPDRYFKPVELPISNKKGRKPLVVDNLLLSLQVRKLAYDLSSLSDDGVVQGRHHVVRSLLDNVLHGVARLDLGGNTRPLRKSLLYKLLASLPVLSVATISDAVGVGERQAQRYLKACVIARNAALKFIKIQPDEIGDMDALIVAKLEKEIIND